MRCTIVLILLFLISGTTLKSQNFEWVNHISGINQDRVRGICTNSQNEIIITGFFSGTVDFDPGAGIYNLTTTFASTGFAAKYDSNNNLIWAVKFEGSTGATSGYACSVDANDNVLIVGNYSSIVDFDPGPAVNNFTASGGIDFYVVKLDNAGNFLWAKTFGTTGTEEAYTVCSDENLNIYLGGYSSNTIDMDPNAGVSNISAGGFICKLTKNGDFKWASRFATTEVRSIKSQENQVVSTGNFNGTVDFNPGAGTFNLTGTSDIYVLKLDTLGIFNWAFKITGNDALAIALDSENNIYCNGYFGGTFDFDPGPGIYNLTSSASSSYILKVNPNGLFKYAYCFNGPGSSTGIDLVVDQNKNVYTTGLFYNTVDFDPGTGIYNMTSVGNEELYITKTDSTGNLVWARSAGSTGWDAGYGIAIDQNNSVYVGGSFANTVDFNTDTGTLDLTAQGPYDAFVMKLNQLNCSDFTLYIDSAHSSDCNNVGYVSCNVLNDHGDVIYNWNTNPASNDSIAFPVTSGIYSVTVSDSINCSAQRSVLINGPVSLSGFDLNANLISENFRAGAETFIWLNGFNEACDPISGNLKLKLDSMLDFNFSIPMPDLISGDTLIWIFTSLYYDNSPVIPIISVNTDTVANFGDSLCLELLITPISSDLDSSNNIKQYCFMVIDSYDPNDKQVYPQGDCIPNYLLNGEKLTYTIRFQNTGNADAINIHILDTLDPNLDLNTLRVIGNSHYVITEILPGNVMNFRFDNIHLPDSGTNELLSHGYVIYEVSPIIGTPDYTMINNTSHIYFDFNPAIITNTVFNTLVDSIPSYSTSENITVCHNSEYTMPDGTVYSNIISPISHQSNLWMVDGCDSIITVNLDVLPIIDTGITIIQEIFGLESQASGMNYQWYDCNTQLPLAGETSQILSPIQPGEYYVVVSNGNCSDTSACYVAGTIGMNEISSNSIQIYPNPAQNEITVFLQNNNINAEIEIYSLNGQLLFSVSSQSQSTKISVNEFSSGIYFVKVKTENGIAYFKLMKD